MARESKLRVVTPEDVPQAPKPPKTLVDAAELSERALLVAMRSKVLKEIDGGVPPAYLAPLMRQVREMDKELRALDLRAKEEGADAADVAEDEAWEAEAL